MPLDFKRIKEVKLIDVLARYKIPLRFRGEYATCACPLPTHKRGDTSKTFSVHLEGNYWRCFSESCNANNGGKRGGDVINFVALMEGCREVDAAAKLADWFGIPTAAERLKTKTPARMEQGSKPNKDAKNYPESSSGGESVKYMASVDAWFDEMIRRGDQEEIDVYLHRVRNAVKTKLIESYRAGKRAAQGLSPT